MHNLVIMELVGMNWDLEFNKKLNIIIVTYNGYISAIDYYDSTIAGIELSNEISIYRGLVDSRNAVTDCTKADMFKIPYELYNTLGLKKSIRIAVLEPLDTMAKDLNAFFILTCRNLGWDVQSFKKRKRAINWLLKVQ